MLSKFDILKELGKGICVYPLNLDNIKENSLNLCAGEFAWSTESCTVYYNENEIDKNKRFSINKDAKHDKQLSLQKGHSAIACDSNDNKYIIILPLATTLIETKEVLSVSNYIGGTYHSKVGMVSKGLGHIGTMVGPNFSGDSLIAFHNTTKNLIVLKTGDSFVSVVFHYLNTPYTYMNPTLSGHTDKFAELGLYVSEDDASLLNQDWKKKFVDVCRKMCESSEYKTLQKKLKEQQQRKFKKYFCKKNIIISLITITILVALFILALVIDNRAGNTTWTDRFFNVGCSGIIVAVITGLIKLLKDNANK